MMMKSTIDGAQVSVPSSSISPSISRDAIAPLPRRLRITHMVSSLKVGGMEQIVLSLAHAQQADGHELNIIALHGGPLEAAACEQNLRAHIIGGQNKAVRLVKAARLLARLKPDIIHVHNPTSLHYAVLGKFVGKSRLLLTDHAQTRGIVRFPSALELRLLDAVVAVSAHTGSQSEKWGWQKEISVIHNGVSMVPSTRAQASVRAELGISDAQPVGIMVASLNKVKGHSVLLDALATLRDKNVALTLLIVGGGAERENLEALAQKQNLGADRVRFLGIRPDVADLLIAADFFVLPSLMEGLPLAVLEAMTAGIPVIATPVGGVPELVAQGTTGLLVPPNHSSELAQAMLALLNSDALRRELGAAGKHKVAADFTFAQMTAKYEQHYYQLCASANQNGKAAR